MLIQTQSYVYIFKKGLKMWLYYVRTYVRSTATFSDQKKKKKKKGTQNINDNST